VPPSDGRHAAAKRIPAPLPLALLLFAGGFIVIGGEWFQMWQSEEWNGLDPALQNVTVAGLALILAHLPSRDWDTAV
jgi:predicted small integral membrane protein